MIKNENPERNNNTHKYMLSTPSSGMSTIRSKSERLYLNINIQTYMVIAPPSRPVMQSLPATFSGGRAVVCSE